MNKKLLGLVLGAMLITLLALISVVSREPRTAKGSTFVGNDYNATSTKGFTGTALTNLTVLKTSGGAVARITVTGANTGIVRLYNATTSNVDLRLGNKATSTLRYIELPASIVAGVYDFDVDFDVGILYELVSGTAPTSTIVWR